jgi:hypothetical protein
MCYLERKRIFFKLLVSLDFYLPSRYGSYFCHTLYNIKNELYELK